METQENTERSSQRPEGYSAVHQIHSSSQRVDSLRVLPRRVAPPCRQPSPAKDWRVQSEGNHMATRASMKHDPLYVPGQGERALMRAVLLDAIECLTGNVSRSRARAQHAAEARAWVETRDREWPFSFDNICSVLDFDAERVRKRLLAHAITMPVVYERAPRVREEEVTAMIRAGHPLRVVAAKFGISMPKVSVLSRGLASRLKAERDEHIWSLRRSGWTVSALASHFRLSLFRIRRIC